MAHISRYPLYKCVQNGYLAHVFYVFLLPLYEQPTKHKPLGSSVYAQRGELFLYNVVT